MPSASCVGPRVCVIIVRPPERGEVLAEVQFKVARNTVADILPFQAQFRFLVVQNPARCRPAWVFDILQLELADRLNRQGVFTAITTRGLKTLIT